MRFAPSVIEDPDLPSALCTVPPPPTSPHTNQGARSLSALRFATHYFRPDDRGVDDMHQIFESGASP
eukprot:377075-Prymnesium_polylepis.1